MKHLLVGIGILSAIVCGCVLCAGVIADRTERITAPLTLAVAAEQRGDSETAGEYAAQAQERWSESRRLFDALLSHEHIDEISLRFRELPKLLPAERRRVCEDLILLLKNIAETEQPLWHNVF